MDPVQAALRWSADLPDDSVDHVLIGRSDVFADNLASGALQGDAVLLLTAGDRLDSRVRGEILRLGASTVTIIGGEAAISQGVQAELEALVSQVGRLFGGARWDTAIEVVRASGATTVILARAFDADGGSGTAAWADSVAAGAWAAASGYGLLLTPSDELVASVAAFLAEGAIDRVVIVGGAGAITPALESQVRAIVPDTSRVSGPTRNATAVAIANERTGEAGVPRAGGILIPGFDPSGWAGGVAAASTSAARGWPIVLVNEDGSLSVDTQDWLQVRPIEALVCGPAISYTSCEAAQQIATVVPAGAMGVLADTSNARPGPYGGSISAFADHVNIIAADDGTVTVVSLEPDNDQLVVGRLDAATFGPVGDPIQLSLDGWPKWGGHYAAPTGDHYVLVGRDNELEDPRFNTVAIRRYDREWDLVGTAQFTSDAAGVFEPFAFTSPSMVLADGRLIVHMARTRFLTDDGLHHQSNLTLEVDVRSMTVRTYDRGPYSGHSFNQLVSTDSTGSDLVFMDHGDAYPRAIQVGVVRNFQDTEPDEESQETRTYHVIEFDGRVFGGFYQYTGTTVTGMDSGPAGMLLIGNSVRHSGNPDVQVNQEEHRNAYALTFDPRTGEHDLSWITRFPAAGGSSALEPRMVKLDDDRFVMLFTVLDADGSRTLEYRLLDSSGRVRAEETLVGRSFDAVSEPALVDDTILWAGQPCCYPATYLYGLDVADPTAPTPVIP